MKEGNTKVSMCTVDTDVVILVVKSDQRLNYAEVWIAFGTGRCFRSIAANEIAHVRSFLIAAMTRYSGFFLLSSVTRFACDIGQLAKIWI